MISRMLLALINNLRLVEKLAESRPIRRAAQVTAYAITRAQITGKDVTDRMLRSQTVRQVREETGKVPGGLGEVKDRVGRVRDTFVKEMKEGWKQGSRQVKD